MPRLTAKTLLLALTLSATPFAAALAEGSACENDYNAPGCRGTAIAAPPAGSELPVEGLGPDAVEAPTLPETPAPDESTVPGTDEA